MPESTLILDAAAIQRALTRIAHEIVERNEAGSEVVLVGIQRGGVPLGQRLGTLLTGIWRHAVPTGSLDVSMHRDDLDRRVAPNVQPTVIPFDVTGKTVVLVDDVLFSGCLLYTSSPTRTSGRSFGSANWAPTLAGTAKPIEV